MISIKVSSLYGKNTTAMMYLFIYDYHESKTTPSFYINTILFFMKYTFCWNMYHIYI